MTVFSCTSVGLCDLSQCAGLDAVTHIAPSSIGVDTLIASFRGAGNKLTPQLETFFRGGGVPEELLRALPEIVKEIRYYSCFISHGEPDRAFAEKLYDDLKGQGISCWLFSKDYTPGEPSRREILEVRRAAEKMIVLCSANGLVRDNFLNEIEDQIDEDPAKIVPIPLDKLWRHPGFKIERGSRNLKKFLNEPNYADFSDASKYEETLEWLAKKLRRQDNS